MRQRLVFTTYMNQLIAAHGQLELHVLGVFLFVRLGFLYSHSEPGLWKELVLLCTEKFFLGHWNPPLPLGFFPKWGSYLGQTMPSPWTPIQCTLFCRGGRNGPTSGSSTPLSQNAAVCGALYGLLCLLSPSPCPHCWMSAPWLSLGSFAPRKWAEEGEEKERGSREGGEKEQWMAP